MKKRIAIGIGLVAVAGFGFAMWVTWNERPVDMAGAEFKDFFQ